MTRQRAAIYARISMDRSGEALGVERQIQDCEKLAESRDLEIVAVLQDNDISAFSGKLRPEYEALLNLMRDGEIDVVITWHHDRLHRSMKDFEEYVDASEKHQIPTLAVRSGEMDLSSANGRMLARFVANIARHESEQKSERVSRARLQAAEKGLAHGHLGFGYDAHQNVVLAEAKIIKEIANRVIQGDTLYSIANDLNSRGVPSPGAGKWHHHHIKMLEAKRPTGLTEPQSDVVLSLAEGEKKSRTQAVKMLSKAKFAVPAKSREVLIEKLTEGRSTPHGALAKTLTDLGVPSPSVHWRAANLRTMIRRGSLCGWRDFEPGGRGGRGVMVAEGTWTPILSKATSERIRTILDAPGRKSAGRHPKYLLVGVVRCGECGAPLSGITYEKRGTRRYQCTSQPGLDRCGKLAVTAPPIDAAITEAVLERLSDVPFRKNTRRLNTVAGTDIDAAEKELADLETESLDWKKDLESGAINRAVFMAAKEGIEARRKPLEKLLGSHSPERIAALSGVPLKRDEIETWWDAATVERQRKVVRALIEKVIITKAKSTGNRFDPARIGVPIWIN